jgi:serine/threonine-protein kinase RsbW
MTIRRRRFSGGPAAPWQARRAVRETLASELSEPTLGKVELLVSELATNSVRHAGCDDESELDMIADVRRDRVRVRVCDDGTGFDGGAPDEPDPDAAGGYGLVLVDRLAADWGVERDHQFCVWFELDRA